MYFSTIEVKQNPCFSENMGVRRGGQCKALELPKIFERKCFSILRKIKIINVKERYRSGGKKREDFTYVSKGKLII